MPLLQGIAATLVALGLVSSWMALGSSFLSAETAKESAGAAFAVVIGSGVTSFVLALLAAAGLVVEGVILVLALCVGLLVLRRRQVSSMWGSLAAVFRQSVQGRVMRAALATIALVQWITAISPPRNADAMRYHLAHVRQIIMDGGWKPIADYHYALPFGWSLSYLPFELLGLPQGSQVLVAILFVVMAGALLGVLARLGVGVPARLAALILFLHPFVLRSFAEPSADGYSIFVVMCVGTILVRARDLTPGEAVLAGFVSWIGIQSRYQLVAIGIVSTVLAVSEVRRRHDRLQIVTRYAAGAILAICLASPFYVANFAEFGNAVWPLLVKPIEGFSSYADVVAHSYSQSLAGRYDLREGAGAIKRLLTTAFLFPLPVASIAIGGAALVSRKREARLLGTLALLFLLLWAAMQPRLYPRFIVLLVPVSATSLGILLQFWTERDRIRPAFLSRLAISAFVLFAAATIAVSWDSIRYAVTGNERAYHRSTWFYPVYDWVNRATPADARFLVIVSSGHSYYLDRPYRRADPWLSGVVDWRHTSRGAALRALLDKEGYSLVIYEDRDWSQYEGGRQMMTAVREAIDNGWLTPVRVFDERLYTSRLRGQFRTTRVVVLKAVAHDSRGVLMP